MKNGNNPKVWIEALTPKQALLFSILAVELLNDSFEILITSRRYDVVEGIFKNYGLKPIIVGSYGGNSLEEKLQNSLERQRELLKLVSQIKPHIHVTFVSPDSSRIAFGLKIPIVSMSDSPHSIAVSKLVIPISTVFITPDFLTKNFEPYIKLTQIHFFKGIFEIAWINRLKPDSKVPKNLGLKPFNYIVVRPPEIKSYYYPNSFRQNINNVIIKIIEQILEKTDLTVLMYSRYDDQKSYFQKTLEKHSKRVTFLAQATDMPSLEFYSRLVITGGATMATEAALLGTPSICLFPKRLELTEYVSKKGFPLYHIYNLQHLKMSNILGLVEETQSTRYKLDHINKAKKTFEDPIPKIKNIVKNLSTTMLEESVAR